MRAGAANGLCTFTSKCLASGTLSVCMILEHDMPLFLACRHMFGLASLGSLSSHNTLPGTLLRTVIHASNTEGVTCQVSSKAMSERGSDPDGRRP
jgi:hypothetical protein